MNDPIGLIFWNDQYHMFYQCNPAGTSHANICWGHVVSNDLLHWSELPIALRPTPGSPDQDGCWSGCATVHNGQVHLIYTGVQGDRQRPCLAWAMDDGLLTFEKLAENPIIAEPPFPGLVGFRDHGVRRVGDEFRQVIGSGSDELGGCVLEYRSKDLLTWDFCGVLISGRALGLPGTMWECPDLFFLEDRCFLVVSLLQNKDHAGELFVGGTFDGDRFIPETNGQLDIGSRLYASQSLDAPDGRRIAFGWLRERLEELPTKYRGRVGVMSLPRKFFVRASRAARDGAGGRIEPAPRLLPSPGAH